MLSRLANRFVWPSGKKLTLLPFAAAATLVFWWLCRLAEAIPVPGVAEPGRSPAYWAIYAGMFGLHLVDVIALASRKSPDWYTTPADAAINCVVYPFSILAARTCIPFVTIGFLDPSA